MLHTLLAFIAFCFTASAVYVSNDLIRPCRRSASTHGKNCGRSLPAICRSGSASSPLRLLFLIGLAIASFAGVAWLVAGYALVSSVYSMKLKEFPLVDVFVLAALYTTRIVTGGVASGCLVSLWLLAFSCFMFLSLGFVKRVAELHAMDDKVTRIGRRGYYRSDLAMLPIMGVAATFVATIILALYVQEISHSNLYRDPVALWAAVPLLLFWQCRLWLATARGYMNDDPIVYAARRLCLWAVGLSLVAAVVFAHLPPLFDHPLFPHILSQCRHCRLPCATRLLRPSQRSLISLHKGRTGVYGGAVALTLTAMAAGTGTGGNHKIHPGQALDLLRSHSQRLHFYSKRFTLYTTTGI